MFSKSSWYLIGIILATIVALSLSTDYYHSKYVTQLKKTAEFEKDNKNLRDIIDANSKAIEGLSLESKKREDIAKKALALSQSKLKDALKKSQEIMEITPGDPGDLCKSSASIINQYLESTFPQRNPK